jgi:hypothetical protein
MTSRKSGFYLLSKSHASVSTLHVGPLNVSPKSRNQVYFMETTHVENTWPDIEQSAQTYVRGWAAAAIN